MGQTTNSSVTEFISLVAYETYFVISLYETFTVSSNTRNRKDNQKLQLFEIKPIRKKIVQGCKKMQLDITRENDFI